MRVLVVLDGAAEPPYLTEPTAFEQAATPALDALCRRGTVLRVRATPAGLPAGSEIGLPSLLGAPPTEPVSRGLVEAASAGLHVTERAWRVDLHHRDGSRASATRAAAARRALEADLPDHELHHLRGHRLLALGADKPELRRHAGLDLHVWGEGARLRQRLDAGTAIICAPGAAAGVGALLGARVITPPGATGDVDSDLVAKADAALELLADAATAAREDEQGLDPEAAAERSRRGGPAAGIMHTVVVHVGAPDEAAHRHDADAKAAAISRADRDVIDPLAAWCARNGATLAVTADHGTDPRTGEHDASPTPLALAGPGVVAGGPDRLTERGVSKTLIVPGPFNPAEVRA